MSDVPVWTCDFGPLPAGDPPIKGAADDMAALTVGAKFMMKCHGDLAVAWDQTPSTLAFPNKESDYTLHILKVLRQDPNDAQYMVTAYKAGEHQPEYLRVMQGEKGFETAKPKWAVKSVLDPQKPAQAYGPFGLWNVGLPIWFIVAVVLGLALIIYFSVRKFRKVSQRRRMLEELKLHTTAIAPLHQFYRDARQLQRRIHTMKEKDELQAISQELDKAFRLFVLRRFQIPTLQWSNGEIVKDLRKRHRKTYRTSGDSLKKTLRELDKLKSRSNAELKDLEQLYRMSMDAAEKLENPGSGR